ncbi:glycosyltransferase [Dysgonomonas sp. 216]|uniref:glycosyltransferase n=1 Tax=Dysgonomonas sp. 216 TaxID=2302934 RepID=UPI0013D7A958|nr:glycosyltransferase [Dysgonomonas sp. 216]
MNKNIKVTVLTSLYNCISFLDSYFSYLDEIDNKNEVEVLLLHNSPTAEELAVIDRRLPDFPFVRHIVIKDREGLYETWNRGCDLAKGDYICVWNVDDIRLPDSISNQKRALDDNQDAMLAYGDFLYMFEYGMFTDELKVEPDFNTHKGDFLEKHYIGCFPMWRKSVIKEFGYFDEQFKLVADLDFQMRIAYSGKLVKASGILGYYLEGDPRKLSMNYDLQDRERTAVYLRFGVFRYLNLAYLLSACMRYNTKGYKHKGIYHTIKIPLSYKLKKLPLLFFAFLHLPYYSAQYMKRRIVKR